MGWTEYDAIKNHPSWMGLKISTYVFTYGDSQQTVCDYQLKAKDKIEAKAKRSEEVLKNLGEKT